jgi:hypothetical protein
MAQPTALQARDIRRSQFGGVFEVDHVVHNVAVDGRI